MLKVSLDPRKQFFNSREAQFSAEKRIASKNVSGAFSQEDIDFVVDMVQLELLMGHSLSSPLMADVEKEGQMHHLRIDDYEACLVISTQNEA